MTRHMLSIIATMALFALVLLLTYGCNQQAAGFALPEGDVERGKASFAELQCNACHSVRGDPAIQVPRLEPGHAEIRFALGGPATRVRTYGELVTSIINPSHKISGFAQPLANTTQDGQSRMRIYNEVMTVQQLIDLTAYLQESYQVVRPVYEPMYGP